MTSNITYYKVVGNSGRILALIRDNKGNMHKWIMTSTEWEVDKDFCLRHIHGYDTEGNSYNMAPYTTEKEVMEIIDRWTKSYVQ